MNHPLEKYKLIAKDNFLSNLEDQFYTTYCQELEKSLYVDIERQNNRIKVTGVDLDGKDFSSYISFESYFISEYDKLEKEAYSEIHKFILTVFEQRKKKVYIANVIEELQNLHTKITNFYFDQGCRTFAETLLTRITLFNKTLQDIYQQKKQVYIGEKYDNPKIKWLGTPTQLGTLFFDLWKGQKGTRENPKNLKPLIDPNTNKGELMHFLAKHFIKSDGSEFEPNDFDDKLNKSESKNKNKANEDRIELNYPAPKPSKKPN